MKNIYQPSWNNILSLYNQDPFLIDYRDWVKIKEMKEEIFLTCHPIGQDRIKTEILTKQ